MEPRQIPPSRAGIKFSWSIRVLLLALASLAASAFSQAHTFSYPVQEFRLGIGGTDRSVVATATTSGAPLASGTRTGSRLEKWYLNRVSAGVYEIASSLTGHLVTVQSGKAVTAPDVDGANQRWRIVPVAKDFEGFDLHYKVVSDQAPETGLTLDTATNSLSVASYAGGEFQKFKLNLDGLEGFAGNSLAGGKEKAGTIGGLLGATEFVSTVSELVAALNKTEPLTVVLTADLDMVNQAQEKQRIRDNKTLVGSYTKNTIYDCKLRNDDFNGADAAPSNNIVIRNLNLVARTLNSTGSGVILIYVYGGRNVWVDHNDFSATFAQNKDVEVGKFMWINTPAANWSDGVYNGVNPDYITISYNTFTNRYWTLAFGSQNKDVSRLRSTVMFNRWEQCSRRTPQYSNGYLHVYSSFHTVTGSSNPNASSQVIAGEGSRVLSENLRFEALSGKEIDIDRKTALSYQDLNSYGANSTSATPTKLSVTSLGTSWKASDNYGYSLVAGWASSGKDAKAFTNAYSGCFKSYAQIQYVTDSALSGWVSSSAKFPFLKSIAVGSGAAPKTGAVLDTLERYELRNVNSGLYLAPVATAPSAGTLLAQSATSRTWSLAAAGDGYYRLRDASGDGRTWNLAIQGGASTDGAALELRAFAAGDGQLFKFVADSAGSCALVTKATGDRGCVGISGASTAAGTSAVQWTCNGSRDQRWVPQVRVDRLQGTLVRDLLVLDTANHLDWALDPSVCLGDLVHGGRDFTYTALPPSLVGAEAIRTAADSKNRTTDLARLVMADAATLHVALDVRVATQPAWLSGWSVTADTVRASNGVAYRVLRRPVSKGDTIVLGENGQSAGCLNYVAFATASGTVQVRGSRTGGRLVSRIEKGRLILENGLEEESRVHLFGVQGGLLKEVRIQGLGRAEVDLDRATGGVLLLRSSGEPAARRLVILP